MKHPEIQSAVAVIKLREGQSFKIPADHQKIFAAFPEQSNLAGNHGSLGAYPCMTVDFGFPVRYPITTIMTKLKNLWPDAEITIEFEGRFAKGGSQ